MPKELQEANRYFLKMTEKVYVDQGVKIESFREYLDHRYRDDCYYYSAYALMGLKPDDFLVRGYIENDYHHGWVEFQFEGEEYLFDSMVKEIVFKQEWYERFLPRVNYKKTQREILEKYLNEKYAYEIKDGFWQFKYIVMDTYTESKPYSEVMKDDMQNGYVPSALMLARLEISKISSKILKYIAYVEPSI